MGKVVVIGSDTNQTSSQLVSAWRSGGVDASLWGANAARNVVVPGDLVVGRLDVLPTLDGIEPGLLDLLLLERSGIEVRNSARALVQAHDKLRTSHLLARAGLPQPRSGWIRDPAGPLPVEPPLVIKPRFGSWGRDVVLCEDERAARLALHAAAETQWFRRHGALAQAFVALPGADLRVLVAGGRPLGAVSRLPAPGEWRTNVSLGGSKTHAEPDAAALTLAVAAARACGGDLVVVDLLPLPDGGYAVLELNGAPDFDEDYARSDRSVYLEVAEALGVEPSRDAASRSGAGGRR